MAVHTELVREGAEGIAKQFDTDALPMIFDNLQKHQYQYPEKSTIRELVSNCVDAVEEKKIAISILTGKSKPEEYYLERNEPIFADSNWFPDYFDLDWLDKSKNLVEIEYTEAQPGVNRDTLRIIDNGVGIGHIVNPVTGKSRLSGVLKLGYSSKRNTNKQLGKFGIGAKAALSTGIDSYVMITRHNGKEFRFDVYDYKAIPIVPRLNFTTGLENPYIIMTEGGEDRVVYYLETQRRNGTEIILPAKRHHRNTFLNAVQSQLLYFDNIKFTVIRENGQKDEIPVKADIQFENEHLLISDNNQFSKPHIIINRVNYGYVNWQELELEDKFGNIAYKLSPEDVTINPSREGFIWDDKTRAAILAAQENVKNTAAGLITEELKETDLILWALKCAALLGESTENSRTIAGKLASYADKTSLKPVYALQPEIKFQGVEDFFTGMEPTAVRIVQKNKPNVGYVDVLSRSKIKSWSELENKIIYLQDEKTSNATETYMMAMHPEGFVKIKVRSLDTSFQEAEDMSPEEVLILEKLKTDETYRQEYKRMQQEFMFRLKKSSVVKLYSDIIVPEGMKAKKGINDADEVEAVVKSMTPAELREIQGRLVCYYPRSHGGWSKEEPIISDIIKDTSDVIYGFKEDAGYLEFLAEVLKGESSYNEFYNKEIKILKVSMASAKYFKEHTYIRDVFVSINQETKTIAMHTRLVKYHTGRKIAEALPKMQFLKGFGIFNPEIKELYKDIVDYSESNYRTVTGSMNEDMVQLADKVIALQVYIKEHPGNTEAIAAQSKALFEQGSDEETFHGSVGVEIEVYEKLQRLIEYASPASAILNYIAPLVDGATIPEELEPEIREIMKAKGLS